MTTLPPLFIERLQNIIPAPYFDLSLESFSRTKVLSGRVNTLKDRPETIFRFFKEQHIEFSLIPWYEDAFMIHNLTQKEFNELEFIKKGHIYQQSLSSMLIPIILDPKPGDSILDMCAAPGGKTSQMAALMKDQGILIALENIRRRYYKLKAVLSLLKVQNASCYCLDARRFQTRLFFDKILIDAPCSCEGRFQAAQEKSFAFWSLRKIKEMQRKQRGLLFHGLGLLPPRGILVYATCTFAPEENEEVINWALQKMEGSVKLLPVKLAGAAVYPALRRWQDKIFHEDIQYCLRILPDQNMEGFFAAKFMRI